jgi:D-alanyl-D-alanine dipeptidase
LLEHPPEEKGDFLKPDLVELRDLDPSIHYDIRYATADNFLDTPVYSEAHAKLQRPAAEAVVRAGRKLRARGFGLLIHDAYRPWFVTKIFWDATPPDKREFVANPAEGSRHNRGCAVDLTLYDLQTGSPVEMPGAYDEMSERSYPGYAGGTALPRWRRDLLRWAMESEGFQVYPSEWWHFDYKDWRQYPILNLTLESGRIYIYARRSTDARSWLPVASDDVVLAKIKRGFFFAFDAPPGRHTLSIERGVPATVDVRSGVDSYVRLDWVIEDGQPPVPALSAVAQPYAQDEMRFLSYVDGRHIAAASVLRADPRPPDHKELLKRD